MKTREKQSNPVKRATDYAHFIEQLQIIGVRLVSAKIDNFGYPKPPSDSRINVSARPWYENAEGRVEVFQRYNLTVSDTQGQHPAAKLSVVFCMTYSSEIPMTDEIFRTFKENSLPLTTWPYFREFVHNSFARMDWIGLVAPAYKSGVGPRKPK